MLKMLRLQDVGPAPAMTLELAPRLNLLTGDNGLGKTFLLETAWWALTGNWAGEPAWPRPGGEPMITYQIMGKGGATKPFDSKFRFEKQEWPRPRRRPPNPGLVVYARVDGGFSIWDPARNYWRDAATRDVSDPDRPAAFHFSPREVWEGKRHEGRVESKGLIDDWVLWQRSGEPVFDTLRRALEILSPDVRERLEPGRPMRVHPGEPRDIPTLQMAYGTVPVTLASAAVRRILSLAYLLVWTWEEHRLSAPLLRQEPETRITFLVDELEAHLHPRWQRSIAPALLAVAEELVSGSDVEVQVFATTHAPLVLASVEPYFDEERDAVFVLDLEGQLVEVRREAWAKQGDAVGWLTSDVFGLEQARSREAERAIEAAEAWMRGDHEALAAPFDSVKAIHKELERVLAGHDPFWPRWIVRYEQAER